MTTAQTQARPSDNSPLTMTAAFEGIEGAYSHVVLEAYAGRRGVAFEPLGCATFRAVAHAGVYVSVHQDHGRAVDLLPSLCPGAGRA